MSRIWRILVLSIISYVPKTDAAIKCNSDFYDNFDYGIKTCDWGACYSRFKIDRSTGSVRHVEAGCSSEFQTSMVNKCLGDTKKGQTVTCTCDGQRDGQPVDYCNPNHRQVYAEMNYVIPLKLQNESFHLRQLSCMYSQDSGICSDYSMSSPCVINNRAHCYVEKDNTGFTQAASTDYVPHLERAWMSAANEWLCEEYEYETRWKCACRHTDCAIQPVTEESMSTKIDRSAPLIECKELDSTLTSDQQEAERRTCKGHVCYAEYERTVDATPKPDAVASEAREIALNLGCRNFSHPNFFANWAYNKVYGHKQKGQMFCKTSMCNEYTVQQFKNISFRLEASAARASAVAMVSVASTILVFFVTAVLSLSSG